VRADVRVIVPQPAPPGRNTATPHLQGRGDLILVRMLQKYRTKPMHFFGKITQWSWLACLLCMIFGVGRAIQSQSAWKAFWGKAPLVGVIFFLLGCFSIMLGLVAELAMRAAFEHNAGRYWEEGRRVNFGPTGE
jgi:hypothetical protein